MGANRTDTGEQPEYNATIIATDITPDALKAIAETFEGYTYQAERAVDLPANITLKEVVTFGTKLKYKYSFTVTIDYTSNQFEATYVGKYLAEESTTSQVVFRGDTVETIRTDARDIYFTNNPQFLVDDLVITLSPTTGSDVVEQYDLARAGWEVQ